MRFPRLSPGRLLFLLGPALLLLAGDISLGYLVSQSRFPLIVLSYSAMFLGYMALLILTHDEEFNYLLILAILLRVMLLFEVPLLSDDIYRFVWDGRLMLNGINPFDHLPAYYLQTGNEVPGLTESLFRQLNSPEYYSVYPPIAQGSFWIAAWIAPDSVWGFSLVLKVMTLFFELGTLYLIFRILRALNLSAMNLHLYALNPLILIELTGNLHFESGMIFFLALTFWLLLRGRLLPAAGALAGSVASKLLPLLFFPLLIRRLGWRKSLWFFSLTAGVLVLLFLPFLNATFFSNITDSLDLYFRRFEFNASVYYLLRWLGQQLVGYNPIQWLGPALAIAVLAGVLWKTFSEGRTDWRSWPYAALFAISLYLFLGTTIHPWYLALPVFLSVFTYYRFPLVWSYLITWTYINYQYAPYWENTWVVALEYAIVGGFLAWELRNKRWSIDLY